MKKALVISLFALSGFTSLSASAAVDSNTFNFACPHASGGTPTQRLTNYGTYIRGLGEESLGTEKIYPLFKGVPGAGVPLHLHAGNYYHNGAQYNPSSGRITCLFASANGKEPFDVSFQAQNIKGGWVISSNSSKVSIKVLSGLAKF